MNDLLLLWVNGRCSFSIIDDWSIDTRLLLKSARQEMEKNALVTKTNTNNIPTHFRLNTWTLYSTQISKSLTKKGGIYCISCDSSRSRIPSPNPDCRPIQGTTTDSTEIRSSPSPTQAALNLSSDWDKTEAHLLQKKRGRCSLRKKKGSL